MSTIKHCLGIRLLIINFGLISFCLWGCKKEPVLPTANVIIQNEYFERLDSVMLSNQKIGKLEVMEQSKVLQIQAGNYGFSCLTKSNLEITANVKIVGSKNNVFLVVKNNGSVTIE